MKYLKRFNESSQSNMNEYYFDLIYLLQDVFDDFDIAPKTDEKIGDYETPEHKFWSIRLTGPLFLFDEADDWASDISNISEVGDSDIKFIIVYNIKESEKESFKKRINDIGDRFVAQTGMRFKLKQEDIDPMHLYDFIIEIHNPVPKVSSNPKRIIESKGYSLDEVTTYIKDMLLDFEDDGFDVKVESRSLDRFDNFISISIDSYEGVGGKRHLAGKLLDSSKVLTFTDRLKSYFDMEGIKYDIQYQWHDDEGVFKQTSLDELKLPSDEVQNMWIEIFIEK